MRQGILSIFILFVFASCSLFNDNEPAITVSYNGKPVQYSLELPVNTEISLTITAADPTGSLESVLLRHEAETINLTDLDQDEASESFSATYTLLSPASGEVKNLQIVVNNDLVNMAVKDILLDCLSATSGDMNNPVEIVIPEIVIADGGIQSQPEPTEEVYYYNSQNTAEESDIQLSEPIAGVMQAKRYLKVSGTAVPDDSGYTDRGYHSVLFTADNGNEKSYFTIPVGENNQFRGYLYFKEPGTYTIMAYRAWDSYLYPHTRSTTYSVGQGSSTLKFTVNVASGNEVPSSLHHLIPTRNVDNGTRYLREYAQQLTAGLSTEMDKVKAIYEFIANGDENGSFFYAYYDEIYPGYLDNCWSDIFIASHFLTRRLGVCNDFSELFAGLTRSLGFKVQKVWGYVPGSSGHQWNRIEIDGSWYRLDSTWACGSYNWQQYAEFYPAFNSETFANSHEYKYYSGYTIEY